MSNHVNKVVGYQNFKMILNLCLYGNCLQFKKNIEMKKTICHNQILQKNFINIIVIVAMSSSQLYSTAIVFLCLSFLPVCL